MRKNCNVFEGIILVVSVLNTLLNAFLKLVVSLLAGFLILWLGASVIEVVENNTNPDYEYSEYNAFVMFSELLEK